MKKYITISLILLFSTIWGSAKSYKFSLNNSIASVRIASSTVHGNRSAASGSKMVEVIAYGKSADKAIDKAMMDAVIAATFYGIAGGSTVDNIPPILINGPEQYKKHKKFFDRFFKKGEFLKYVSNVNSTYPAGTHNVSTSKGRKVTVYIIIEWKKLEDYYKKQGLTTQSSLLKFE